MFSHLRKFAKIQRIFFSDEDCDALWRKLHSIAELRFGVTAICYGFTHSRQIFAFPGYAKKLHIKHSFPNEYVSASGGLHFVENSVPTAKLLEGAAFSLWNEAWQAGNLTQEQLEQRAVAEAHRMNIGVSLMLPDFSGHGAAAICFAAPTLDAAEFDRIWSERGQELRQVASAFDVTARPAFIAAMMKLTPRERDVLACAAAGMGGKSIADRLGLHPKTVFNTMQCARKSLQAASTIEAAAKAVVYGLI